MSCKHGNHEDACDICDEISAAYESGLAARLAAPAVANAAKTDELPKLPEPFGHIEVEDAEGWTKDIIDGWTADQMRGYAIDYGIQLGRAAIVAQAPQAALTDGDIERIGRVLPAMQNKSFRFLQGQSMTVPEQREYDAQVAFARDIEAAAAPNAGLVEALQNLVIAADNIGCPEGGLDGLDNLQVASEEASAALANAGVKVAS